MTSEYEEADLTALIAKWRENYVDPHITERRLRLMEKKVKWKSKRKKTLSP